MKSLKSPKIINIDLKQIVSNENEKKLQAKVLTKRDANRYLFDKIISTLSPDL